MSARACAYTYVCAKDKGKKKGRKRETKKKESYPWFKCSWCAYDSGNVKLTHVVAFVADPRPWRMESKIKNNKNK